MATSTPGPRLAALIESGSAALKDEAYIGTASDGVEVQLGALGYESMIEIYLADYPTPESW